MYFSMHLQFNSLVKTLAINKNTQQICNSYVTKFTKIVSHIDHVYLYINYLFNFSSKFF